jgi:hypothetical protein
VKLNYSRKFDDPIFRGISKRKEKFANGTIKKNRNSTVKIEEIVSRVTGTVNPSLVQ